MLQLVVIEKEGFVHSLQGWQYWPREFAGTFPMMPHSPVMHFVLQNWFLSHSQCPLQLTYIFAEEQW